MTVSTQLVDGSNNALFTASNPGLTQQAAGSAIIGKVGIDQTTPGTTNAVALIAGQNGVAAGAGAVSATVQRVTLASDDPLVAKYGSRIVQTTKYVFTRPADTTAYAVGDLIANSTTAGSVVPLSWTGATISGNGGSGIISDVAILTANVSAHTMRFHFVTASPTVGAGDNSALAWTNADLANYLGYIDVAAIAQIATGFWYGSAQNQNLSYKLASGDTLYALIESQTVFTPGNAASIQVMPKLRRYS